MSLFRIKVIEPPQRTIFSETEKREVFIESLLRSKPSEEIRRGYVWHIGNVTKIDEKSLMFAAGRTTRKSTELYDEDTGDFVEIEGKESPFTYVFYEAKYGIFAITPKSGLAPTAKGIARNLEKLLNRQPRAKDVGVEIELSEIWDPEGFLEQIRNSYELVGFAIEFTKPNPFDVERDLHAPMQSYLREIGGSKGRATVQGTDLNKDSVEDVTRSVASTGNDASARIRRKKGQRPVTRRLRGDPVIVQLEGIEGEKSDTILSRIREAYRALRRRPTQ